MSSKAKTTESKSSQSSAPFVSPLDRAIGNLNAATATHAKTSQYVLRVLQILDLAGPRISPADRDRIGKAVLTAFRIEGLAVADATDTVHSVIEASEDDAP